MPQIIRSNYSTKTKLAAAAHYSLSSRVWLRAGGEAARYAVSEAVGEAAGEAAGEALAFRDCFRYSTSKKN